MSIEFDEEKVNSIERLFDNPINIYANSDRTQNVGLHYGLAFEVGFGVLAGVGMCCVKFYLCDFLVDPTHPHLTLTKLL